MRKRNLITAAILLVLAALLGLWPRSGPDAPEAPEDAREPAATIPDRAPLDGPPPSASPGESAGEDQAETTDVSDPAVEVEGHSEAATAEAPPPPAPKTVPPAVRRNPRDPPPPAPSVRPGRGNRPPFGPTGHWSKFPPEIPSGRASVDVLVIDEDGTPIPGADVLLGPPDVAGESAVSYAHLRRLGKTDADGRVTADRLPEGSAAIAGNLNGLLNGRRGLDATTAVTLVLEADRNAKATVRLPLSLGEMGTLRGVVRGADGKPVRAQAFCGFHRVHAGQDGRFEIALVPAGTHTLSVQASSHRSHSEPVVIEAGKATEVKVDLEYKESGNLTLGGSVLGPKGEPVPGARIYVIATSGRGRGTVRSAVAGDDGRYEMASLPDRLYETEVRIQASKMGYRAANVVFAEGLTSNTVDLRLPLKMVRLKLTVLDVATDEPQTRCRFEARKADAERAYPTFSSRGPEGRYETWIEAGTYEFLVEAPDHEAHRVDVEIPEGDEFVYTARLRATGDPAAVEIALTVVVTAVATGEPVPKARIELLGPTGGSAAASFEGRRTDGRYLMPVPSGEWRLRVSAPGHQADERAVRLDPKEPEVEIEVALR